MSKPNKPKERGSADELEIMREIIKNDPFLLDRVLSKIREIRAGGKNMAETVAEKNGAKREEERRKGSGT
jgi:hypothetical protein